MTGKHKHSGSCVEDCFSGLVLFLARVMVIVTPFGDDPLDYEAGAAEIVPGKFPDTDNLRCQPPFGKLSGQGLFIKHLVESDGNHVRAYLFYRKKHIGLVAKHRMVYRLHGCNHCKALVFGNDRVGLMFDIRIACHNHEQFIPEFLRFIQVEEMARMKDIKGACRNNPAGCHGTTSSSWGFPSAVKQRQSLLRYGYPIIR